MNASKALTDEPESRSFLSSLVAIFRASHFVPCVSVTVISGLIAYFSGQRSEILILAPAVLFGQFAIGWSNDFIDRDKDRINKRSEKPIAAGQVHERTIKTLSISALIISLMLSFMYGFGSGIVHLIALTSAFLYNFKLKQTVLSFTPFIVSFGLLPVFVAQGDSMPYVPAAWMVIAAALLGVAIHFQNVIPDFAYDAKTGVKGFPHYFSYAHSVLLGALLLVFSTLSIALGLPADAGPVARGLVGLFSFAAIAFLVLYVKKNLKSAWTVSTFMALLCVLVLVSGAPYMRG